MVLKSLHHCIGRKIEQVSKKYGVTGVQFFVLTYLIQNENKDVYQKDIEKFLDVRGSTATGILQNLTQKGFIERMSSDSDARLKKIVLCEKAKSMINDFEIEMKELQEYVEKDIEESEKEIFIEVVEKLKHNIESV